MVNLNLLPKKLRRRAGPDWWRTAAIVVPLLILGVVAYLTLQTLGTLNARIDQRDQLKAEVQILRPYVAEYQKLERRRRELEQIAGVAREVRATFKPWSEYLANFLKRLPSRRGRLLVSLNSINARSLNPSRAESIYGIPAQVEFSLRGEAASEQALVNFVKVFETDPGFGINFQSTSLDKKTGIYSFNASVGMVVTPPKPKSQEEQNEGGS